MTNSFDYKKEAFSLWSLEEGTHYLDDVAISYARLESYAQWFSSIDKLDFNILLSI